MARVELYHDNFQNYKRYNIKKAQLVIADIPYNIGSDAYGSNPQWYEGGDNKTEKANLQKLIFLMATGNSILRSIFIFVISYWLENRKKKEKRLR